MTQDELTRILESAKDLDSVFDQTVTLQPTSFVPQLYNAVSALDSRMLEVQETLDRAIQIRDASNALSAATVQMVRTESYGTANSHSGFTNTTYSSAIGTSYPYPTTTTPYSIEFLPTTPIMPVAAPDSITHWNIVSDPDQQYLTVRQAKEMFEELMKKRDAQIVLWAIESMKNPLQRRMDFDL